MSVCKVSITRANIKEKEIIINVIGNIFRLGNNKAIKNVNIKVIIAIVLNNNIK